MFSYFSRFMLYNKTKKQKISDTFKLCTSFFSKSTGLMFSTQKKIKNTALVFAFNKPVQFSFHMFFVFYPIDLILLDDKKRVIELKKNFNPFSVYFPQNKYSFAVEASRGAIAENKKEKISIGDELLFNIHEKRK